MDWKTAWEKHLIECIQYVHMQKTLIPQDMAGGGSWVEGPDGNRKVASSNPGSLRAGVEVSLSETLNP